MNYVTFRFNTFTGALKATEWTHLQELVGEKKENPSDEEPACWKGSNNS